MNGETNGEPAKNATDTTSSQGTPLLNNIAHNEIGDIEKAKMDMSHEKPGEEDEESDEDYIPGEDPTVKEVLCRMLNTTLQNGTCNVLEVLETVILVFFLGQDTEQVQAAVGLATVMKNCFAYAVTYSLSLGLEAIASQSYGYGSHELCGIYLQKAIILGWALLVPICIIFGFIQPFLVAIGIEPDIAKIAWEFMMLSIPHTFFVALADQVKAFLHAQNIFHMPTIASVCTMAAHFGLCWLFIIKWGWGFYGAALSINVCEGARAVLMILFSRNFPSVKKTWTGWSRKCLDDWGNFLKVSFGMGAFVYLEWVCFELFTIQAGALRDEHQLAAQVILTNLYICFYQLGEGVHISLNTYVSQCVGENNKKKAITLSWAALIVLYGQFIVLAAFLIPTRNFWFDAFTKAPEVQKILHEVFWPFLLVMIPDWLQVMLMGILKAINKQIQGSIACIIAFLIIGQPIVYYCTFVLDMKISGIWYPYMIPCILSLFLYSWVIFRTNWDDQVKEVQERLEDDASYQAVEDRVIGNISLQEPGHPPSDYVKA